MKVVNSFIRCLKIVWYVDKIELISIVIISLIAGIIPTLSIITMQKIMKLLQIGEVNNRIVIWFAVLYISIDIGKHLLNKVITIMTFSLERKVNIDVSTMILKKTRELELEDFENTETYNLIQRAQSSNVVFSYVMFYVSVLQALITIISNCVVLEKWVVLVMPLIIIVTIIRSIYLSNIGKKKYTILRRRTSKERKRWYLQYLLTNDTAFKEIKLYDLHQYFIKQFKDISISFLNTDCNINKQQHIVDGGLLIADSILTGGIFLTLIMACSRNECYLGDVVAYIRSITNIKKNVESFCLQIVVVWESTLKLSQLFEFLDININTQIGTTENIHIDEIEEIQIIDLRYKYKNSSDYILKGVNLNIQRGHLYYLIGMNGSGKSTLLKILSGYYTDYGGDILINGINLRRIDIQQYRKRLGILFQDYVKYEFSLRDNIELSNLEGEKAHTIMENLNQVGFNKKINLDTQLGYWFEDGCQLSGGEWLKIALARTINRFADVYFFDEPNAALDPLSDKRIIKFLNEFLTNKIGIIVTHKIQSIRDQNETIILLKDGQVVANGNHEDLYKDNEIYQQYIDLLLSKY